MLMLYQVINLIKTLISNRFRSCVLRVMSPARFRCAILTKCCCKQLYRWYVSIVWPQGYEPRALPLRHTGKIIPSACFDHATLELWALRSSTELRRWEKFITLFLVYIWPETIKNLIFQFFLFHILNYKIYL